MANTTTARSDPPPGGTWATPHDWATHRQTITALYEGQNMTLKKIMQIMEKEHKFFATERMYKSRLKQWGLRKNYRYEEVNEIIRQQSHFHRSALAKLPPTSDIGASRMRKLDARRRAYARQQQPLGIEVKGQTDYGYPNVFAQGALPLTPPSSAISCRAPSPAGSPPISMLFPLTPPEDLKGPEDCAFLVHNYFTGAFEMGLWDLQRPGWVTENRTLPLWFNRITLFRSTVRAGHTKQGFQLLQICFDEFKEMITSPDPRLLIYMCVAITVISEFPDVVRMLLKYLSNLSGIIHGPGHPLHQLLVQFQLFGMERVIELSRHICECHLSMFDKYLGANNDFVSSVTVYVARNLSINGLIDTNAAESMLLSVPAAERNSGRVVMSLATVYAMGKRYGEARRILEEQLSAPQEHERTKAGFYDSLFVVSMEEGNDQIIRETSHRRIQFCLQTFGAKNEWTVDAVSDLQTHLRSVGDNEAAERVVIDYGIQIGALSEGVAELQITS